MTDADFDYEDLGLVAGLEIHQQLDTATKLFCACPTEIREPEAADHTFTRYLHPTKSELGEIDDAALEESMVDREFEYLAYDTTCLVEEDDEPPHRVDEEAMETAMEISQLLNMHVVDQVNVMRKIVVDGSNTTGFQRSMLVANDGAIETSDGPVGIEDMLLEEESCQRVEETDEGVRFSLDRLGIPLVEIGTKPDISSPEQAREAAQRIGMLLRSTGKVKRGLGTIRQDVNVSIAEGARIELKGVQSLDDIDDLVRNEVRRQVELVDIADELREREASVGDPEDVTEVFEGTDSGVIGGALADGGAVHAVRLAGFDGLVGREIQPDRRLGTEFSDPCQRRPATPSRTARRGICVRFPGQHGCTPRRTYRRSSQTRARWRYRNCSQRRSSATRPTTTSIRGWPNRSRTASAGRCSSRWSRTVSTRRSRPAPSNPR